jgi:hypothetical protein
MLSPIIPQLNLPPLTHSQVMDNYDRLNQIAVICASDPQDRRCLCINRSTKAAQKVWDLKYNMQNLRRLLGVTADEFDNFLFRIAFVPTIQDAIALKAVAIESMQPEFMTGGL